MIVISVLFRQDPQQQDDDAPKGGRVPACVLEE
jgi:hypothetical protein